MTKFTAGPARVIRSSWRGWRGMESNCAMPPIGISRMRRTWTPKCMPVKECPSSWSTTQVKKASSVAELQTMPPHPVVHVALVGRPAEEQEEAEMHRQLDAADAEEVD